MLPCRTLTAILLTLAASGFTDAPRTMTAAQPSAFDAGPGNPAGDANRLTDAEMSALIQHIAYCWHTTNNHPDSVFDLDLTVNPDRTIADARIVRPKDAASDQAAYRLADETAAELKTGPCSPLPLPPEKYAAWRQMTLHMDFRPPGS
jgi:hypothetical protein